MLAIWFMMLAQSIRGSGLGGAFEGVDRGFLGYLVESSFIPTRIFIFAVMEGSVVALVIGTLSMLVCHFTFESTRWVIPPSISSILGHKKT